MRYYYWLLVTGHYSKPQSEKKKLIQGSLQDIEPSHVSEMVPTLASMKVMMETPSVPQIELLTWPECLVLTDLARRLGTARLSRL